MYPFSCACTSTAANESARPLATDGCACSGCSGSASTGVRLAGSGSDASGRGGRTVSPVAAGTAPPEVSAGPPLGRVSIRNDSNGRRRERASAPGATAASRRGGRRASGTWPGGWRSRPPSRAERQTPPARRPRRVRTGTGPPGAGEEAVHDRGQPRRQLRAEVFDRARVLGHPAQRLGDPRPARERHLAGEQVVQRAAERVLVRPVPGGAGVRHLFGGRVVRRPHQPPGFRQVAGAVGGRPVLRQPHVEHLQHPAAVGQAQVGGLDVAVYQAPLVHVVQSQGGLPRVLARAADGEPPTGREDLRQVRAGHVLHHQVAGAAGGPGVVRVDHVRVVEAAEGAHLAEEPRPDPPAVGRTTLTAARRPSVRCRARNTWPMPPRPTRSRSVYEPTKSRCPCPRRSHRPWSGVSHRRRTSSAVNVLSQVNRARTRSMSAAVVALLVAQIVESDEVPECPEMIPGALGERQGLPHEPRAPLTQGEPEPFDVCREPRVLAHGLVS